MVGERGFLTKTDRKFLRGDKEYTGENAKQQRYERREAIAARARQAFHDFAFLYEAIDERERNRIFDPPEEDRSELVHSLWDTIAFLHHSLEGDVGSEPQLTLDRSVTATFESVLKTGVQRGESNRRPDDFSGLVSVEYDVDVTALLGVDIDWEDLIDRLANRDINDISEQEIRTIVALATNPTDRLRELADMIEESRGGDRYHIRDGKPFDPDEVADEASTLAELFEESSEQDP